MAPPLFSVKSAMPKRVIGPPLFIIERADSGFSHGFSAQVSAQVSLLVLAQVLA